MKINTDNPIIKFSGKGKPFQYDKLLYATLNEYILDYKNARLDKLTDQDASICLARIIRKMEVNDVPVQQFFHEELEKWSEHTNYEKILRLCELMARISSAVLIRTEMTATAASIKQTGSIA